MSRDEDLGDDRPDLGEDGPTGDDAGEGTARRAEPGTGAGETDTGDVDAAGAAAAEDEVPAADGDTADGDATPATTGRAARRRAERAAADEDEDAAPSRRKRSRDRDEATTARAAEAERPERTGPVQFLREVRSELRKVAWPGRRELLSYTVVVLTFSLVLTLLVWGFDEVIRNAIINTLG